MRRYFSVGWSACLYCLLIYTLKVSHGQWQNTVPAVQGPVKAENWLTVPRIPVEKGTPQSSNTICFNTIYLAKVM